MTGTEIIEALAQNPGDVLTAVGTVTSAVLTAIFLRSNTSTTEFEKLKAGKFNEALEVMLKNGQMTYTELYKSKNFLSVAKKADKYYSKMPHDNDCKEHNFDWYVRFFENVGNVSDESLQEFWAKILAGEINKPQSYSLKTLDTLKNIGKAEAELFAKILSCCVFRGYDGFLPSYKEYLKANKITYSEIMYLSEHGLIYNDAMLVLNLPLPDEDNVLFVNKNRLMFAKATDEKNKNIEIKQYPLTAVGKQIATLIDKQLSDNQFILFGRELKKACKKVNISVYDIVEMDETGVTFDNAVNYIDDKDADAAEQKPQSGNE